MNAIGIDVSKGKSTVAVLRPYSEVVVSPFDVAHTGSDLRASELVFIAKKWYNRRYEKRISSNKLRK